MHMLLSHRDFNKNISYRRYPSITDLVDMKCASSPENAFSTTIIEDFENHFSDTLPYRKWSKTLAGMNFLSIHLKNYSLPTIC